MRRVVNEVVNLIWNPIGPEIASPSPSELEHRQLSIASQVKDGSLDHPRNVSSSYRVATTTVLPASFRWYGNVSFHPVAFISIDLIQLVDII